MWKLREIHWVWKNIDRSLFGRDIGQNFLISTNLAEITVYVIFIFLAISSYINLPFILFEIFEI